jgi:hypothetical protein
MSKHHSACMCDECAKTLGPDDIHPDWCTCSLCSTDYYKKKASELYKVPFNEVTPEQRAVAKVKCFNDMMIGQAVAPILFTSLRRWHKPKKK